MPSCARLAVLSACGHFGSLRCRLVTSGGDALSGCTWSHSRRASGRIAEFAGWMSARNHDLVRVVLIAAALPALALGAAAGRASVEERSGWAASRPPAVCPRLLLEVEFAFGMWGGPGTPLQREQFAAVGSSGADKPGGYVIFGSATPTKAYRDPVCQRSSVPQGIQSTGLAQIYRYRVAGGNAYFIGVDGDRIVGELLHPRTASTLHLREPSGVAFSCPTSGRVTVRLKDIRQGGRSVGTELRVFDSRRLLGLAAVRRSSASYFRVARSCVQD
jgi:hypothetical protein